MLASAPTSLAAQRLYRLEVGGGAGYYGYDNATDLGGTVGGNLRLGYWVYGPLSIEAEGTLSRPTTTSALAAKVSVKSVGAFALFNAQLGHSAIAFLRGGYASVTYGGGCPSVSIPGSGPCGSAGAIIGGAGIRLALTPALMLRTEGVVSRSQTALKFNNYALNAGLSVMLGSQPLTDLDKDRVYDRKDRCPDTPPGALVDKRGCPTDADGDQVFDGLDRCPGTQRGAAVDKVGCPADSDSDGVLDGVDQCENTPAGATVDNIGCPRDGDGDKVLDGLDRCPDSPAGAKVDALGCPNDSDNDGVYDGIDRCPDTPSGVSVNAFGCPPNQDSDGDGVRDAVDRCPDTPANAPVGRDGCPAAQPADTAKPPAERPVAPEPKPAAPAAAPTSFVVPGQAFPYRSARLLTEARAVLDSVAALMSTDSTVKAAIYGYAQDRLVPADNVRLSRQRADAVRTYLIGKGIAATRLVSEGRGSSTLIVSDTTDAARTVNRRVEIRLQKP